MLQYDVTSKEGDHPVAATITATDGEPESLEPIAGLPGNVLDLQA